MHPNLLVHISLVLHVIYMCIYTMYSRCVTCSLATFHLTCTVEVAIEDVSEGSNQNQQALLSSSKSCGHSCEAESQALCCICTVEQGAVHATEDDNIVRALSNCSLCQRLVRLRASNCNYFSWHSLLCLEST